MGRWKRYRAADLPSGLGSSLPSLARNPLGSLCVFPAVPKSLADDADGVFILTCLYTRWMLIRRNKQKEAAQALEGTGTNALAFEVSSQLDKSEDMWLTRQDLTDRQNPDFRYSL
jgi:hypothetical protein